MLNHHGFVERGLDDFFRVSIKGGSGLVEEENAGLTQQSACDGDPLNVTRAKLISTFEKSDNSL